MEARVSIPEQLSNSLQARWEKYLQELDRCRTQFSEEAVHDLRVATRRLLALLDLIGILYPNAQTQKLLPAFKDQLDSYDDLRDTQVMLLEIGQRVQEIPSLSPFQKFLAKREKTLLRAAEKNVRGYKLNALEKRLASLHKTLQKIGEDTSLINHLLRTLDGVYASVLKRFQRIDPNIPPTIHRVRVRFKKFRYMVECIHPFLPNFPEGNLRAMHDYQTLMGDIQDVEVLLSTLNTFAAKKNGHTLSQALEYYQNRHTQTIQAYMERKDELFQFWRASATRPFPWEEEQVTASPPTQSPKRKPKRAEPERAESPATPEN
ncbi:MAG: CHAD domain-containing protein [Anaerolineales bacterium]|nr:CHAD domain-containing protein [Anaerolineales bacterium]MDW8161624.1 CHAD domain-containing protein [Anaerolineales bacterium]